MLYGIKQTDRDLLRPIQKYGCLFLCFAQVSPMVFAGEEGRKALNTLWKEAEERGYISGDLNKDGDYDDIGEAEVKDHNGLCRLFALSCHYDGKHHDPSETIPYNVKHIFGCYVWKGTHFVNLNRRLEVTNDSMGYSNTVLNGVLKSTRWYYAD